MRPTKIRIDFPPRGKAGLMKKSEAKAEIPKPLIIRISRMVELKYQQTNHSINTILLNFPHELPHEFTKNVLLFTRADSQLEI